VAEKLRLLMLLQKVVNHYIGIVKRDENLELRARLNKNAKGMA
jgi:hypothetical protein